MLNINFYEFLFSKGILVGTKPGKNAFEVLFTLANKFGIHITEGYEYADEHMLRLAEKMLGIFLPDPFYKGFPHSVRELSSDQLLFDQLLSYFITYGLGNFSQTQHSYFEADFERLTFNEETTPKKFAIVTEEKAVELLGEYAEDMLASTRPLSNSRFDVLKAYITEYDFDVVECRCKNTAIRLLIDTRDTKFAKFLALPDVIKLTEQLNYSVYYSIDIKHLNLRNMDRKFIAAVIDAIFENGRCNVRECFEKKALWCGLLHHIHYKPQTPEAKEFVKLMRSKGNRSVYSEFERRMKDKDIRAAADCLRKGKGSGALLRNLNYMLSRCENEEDIDFLINSVQTDNAVILIQLIMQYTNYSATAARSFVFPRINLTKVHTETTEEKKSRKTVLDPATVDKLMAKMTQELRALLANKLRKVYISPQMYSVALPLQENTSNGGYGVLPKGSKIHLEKGKKIRAFTYWEKVKDIDLSVIGIDEDGYQYEFSWRTMSSRQSDAITYSGDQTSGYYGGTEYFDIDVEAFKKKYPQFRYLIFCNNVYYDSLFSQCLCKAGYMLRDINDTGEVFEPKTVKSSFTVNCDSTFAYLFGIDMVTNDFVWLNLARNSLNRIAADSSAAFLINYFKATDTLNVGKLFEMLAAEVTDSPENADVAVTDEEITIREGAEIIRSYDFEKINALLNN